MGSVTTSRTVRGPWSLTTSREFWEEFAPAPLADRMPDRALRTTFRVESDWSSAAVVVSQAGETATIAATGDGDLDEAVEQTARFLSLDVDGRGWTAVADRDPVIADAQSLLPGLRPCGFHSPYEAAAWAVLSQRLRTSQAAKMRSDIIGRHGDNGAFPSPTRLRDLNLDLPGRKSEYLHSVADAALAGQLDSRYLRSLELGQALSELQDVRGLGPFAAELVLLRGANVTDGVPTHEPRLAAEVAKRYGPERALGEVSQAWAPYRTWAAVHLRALAER